MREILINLPNIPAADVPIGPDESANKEIRRWGEPREFDFEPKDHVDLGEALGILDIERATKITGSRFAILNGAGATTRTSARKFYARYSYIRAWIYRDPAAVYGKPKALFGTNQLPKFEEDLFHINDERGLALIPTAEVPVTNYFADEILDAPICRSVTSPIRRVFAARLAAMAGTPRLDPPASI